MSSTIALTFSEPVSATAGAFALECPAGSGRTFSVSPSLPTSSAASTFTLTPTAALPNSTSCNVTVNAGNITDIDGTPDHLSANYTFTFATVSPADPAPFVTAATPANGTTNVPVTSPIAITFSESVTASPTAFSLQCPTGVPQPFSQSASPAATFALTPSSSLPYSTTCTVSVAAGQISDTDTNDPPDGLTSDATFSFTTAAAPPPGAGIVRINEVDADTPGSDTAEFVELYDGGAGNTPLVGLVVVFFDGTDETSSAVPKPTNGKLSYAAFALDGYHTDANGYFVMGNPGVPGASLTFDPGQFGLLQNGPDAVGLYIGNATDFPSGTPATTTNLQDAIVYGTDDPSASGLLPLTPNQLIVNENANGNSQNESSQRCPNGMGGFRNNTAYRQAAPTPGAVNACPANRQPSDVVISQVYGGGGNGGATYRNDFVELFNRGTAAVDLTGWSLQYASSTGSGWDTNKQPLGGTIGAGEYYLIALASGGANGSDLPAANVSGLINLGAGAGKVALVGSFTGLAGNCPIYDPSIKDLVGYGSADCGEGSTTTAAGSNSTALFRKSNGSLDTDNNANDFSAPAGPTPRRTAPIVELGPNVLTTDPRTNGTDAPRDATIHVTFTEPVTVDPGWFTLTCAGSGLHASATFAQAFGGQDQYITPNDNFTPGERCTMAIFKDHVHDVDLDDAAPNTDTLPFDYAWSFTVASGAAPVYLPSVHTAMGKPTPAGSDPLDYLMEKPEFTISYNRDLGRPNWVSWHLSDDWIGTLARNDTFRPDPQVPQDWYRVQSFDFASSGFDRGHMTPNADRDKETSIPINQATFLMSNMVAQAPANNQGPWAALEGYLRTLVDQDHDELYIVSGPYGEGGTGSNGGVTTTLAGGHVSVPASTWKVALVLPKGDDDLARVTCSTRTIAVIMPNTQTISSDWMTYLTTVDAVEGLTGYNFFSNLPEPYQQCIEAGTNGSNPALVKGNQTIAFAQPADRTYGDSAFTVVATGGASGNPVTFAASGACTSSGVNGATISPVSAGTCTITASQAGSVIYDAAADAVRTLNVNKALASFTVGGYTGIYDGAAHGASGTASGLGGVDLSALLNLGDTFTDAPGGTAHWIFTGDEHYSPDSGDVTIAIAKAAQTITFAALPDHVYGDTPFGVSATGGASGNPVTFAAAGACTAQGATITIVSAGSCSVTASQAGSINYETAGSVTNFINVTKAAQVLTFGALADRVYGAAPFAVSATGGASTSPVTFAASGDCTVLGATVTITAAGVCTVTASQAGDGNYNAATDVLRSFSVAKATPVFSALASPSIEAGTASAAITGAIAAPGAIPGGSVTISIGATSVSAPIAADGHFTAVLPTAALMRSSSPYAIAFTYAGDANFIAATGASTLTVVDTTAPAIGTVSATPNLVAVPDHKMFNVFVDYTAADISGAPVCTLTVGSNEPSNATGDGNTSTDWLIIDAQHVQLRAERAGTGSGRLYTLTVTCADAAGNRARQTTSVSVPK